MVTDHIIDIVLMFDVSDQANHPDAYLSGFQNVDPTNVLENSGHLTSLLIPNVKQALQILMENKLYAKLEKCVFAVQELTISGWYSKMTHFTTLSSLSNAKTLEQIFICEIVESMPCLWDMASPDYSKKQLRENSWITVCRELYPRWHEADANLQNNIESDIRKRWRSVKDRFFKCLSECNKSGASPSKTHIAYQEELQFLCSGRVLRQTEGNIGEPEEPALESTINNEDQSSHASEELVVPPPIIIVDPLCPTTSGSSTVAPSSGTGGHEIQRAKKRKNPTTLASTKPNDPLTTQTLEFLKNTSTEDEFDTFASSMAKRLRQLNNKAKQSACMTAFCGLLAGFEEEGPFPTAGFENIQGFKYKNNIL
ncbi:uncharacterized protein ACNLHF_014047 [Anomaloglossus baeobatrachus]|uniref:uncharacterized protein LOC142297277 n=1 Tax=Anomaloglossus baeobatrachus TaxID=238106 RepID=UPI003F4F5B8B